MFKTALRAGALALAVTVAGCASAPKPVKIVQPIALDARGQVNYQVIDVIVGETARKNVERFDVKAAEKRRDAKLDAYSAGAGVRPTPDQYETLPTDALLRHAIEDAIMARSMPSGRPLKVTVQVDNVRTANVAAAMLVSSNDQMAGLVTVSDAATGQKLGAFTVDVLSTHSGLGGMAVRGGNIREKMAQDFAEHVRNNL